MTRVGRSVITVEFLERLISAVAGTVDRLCNQTLARASLAQKHHFASTCSDLPNKLVEFVHRL